MKRFAIFAILGPPLAAMTLFLLLPLAGLLLHGRIGAIEIGVGWWTVYLAGIFPALVLAFFDWLAQLIELPRRPIGTAIAGWVLTAVALHEWLALPGVPGWIVAIGLLGAIPAFICSSIALKLKTSRRLAV